MLAIFRSSKLCSASENELQAAIRERRLSTGFLIIVLMLAVFDIVEDILDGDSAGHFTSEAIFFLIASLGAVYLWIKTKRLRQETITLRTEMRVLHADSQFWREEAGNYLQGLGEAIDKQFSRWRLTDAEKEVGLLLLKGLSHKEVAQIRNTSDRTIRHQSASVYKKAKLEGRAQLAAFFLEDLLLPCVESTTKMPRELGN